MYGNSYGFVQAKFELGSLFPNAFVDNFLSEAI